MMMRAAEKEWLEENQVIPPDVVIMSLGMFSQGHMWLHVGIGLWGECACIYVCFPTGVGQHNLQHIRQTPVHSQQVSTLSAMLIFTTCFSPLLCASMSCSFSCAVIVWPVRIGFTWSLLPYPTFSIIAWSVFSLRFWQCVANTHWTFSHAHTDPNKSYTAAVSYK